MYKKTKKSDIKVKLLLKVIQKGIIRIQYACIGQKSTVSCSAIFNVKIRFNGLLTGSSVALSGATFDYLYAISGILGIYVLIRYFKTIFLTKKLQHNK